MDLSAFFTPAHSGSESNKYLPEQIGAMVRAGAFWEEADILILGHADIGVNNGNPTEAADAIRDKLYGLSMPHPHLKIVDLGNFKERDSLEAYNEMIAYALKILMEKEKRVLMIGGQQGMCLGQFLAFEELEKEIEYVHVDSSFDLEDSEIQLGPRSVNNKIFLHKPNYLFNYTNLGYQRYFVSSSEIETLKSLNFSALRYGNIFGRPEVSEPYLRTADMLAFDFAAVRGTEAPASDRYSAGGFTAMEACQIFRYAGLAYHLNSISISGFLPEKDQNGQTAMLAAMMCWYFMEGHGNRKDDFPRKDRKNLRKYTVRLHASIESINFYKHKSSGRWWMEVPYEHVNGKKFQKSRLVACNQSDYEFAKGDDIPERWWLVYNKLEK